MENRIRTNVLKETVLFIYYKFLKASESMILYKINKFRNEVLKLYPLISCEFMQKPNLSVEKDDDFENFLEIYRGLTVETVSNFIDYTEKTALQYNLPFPRKIEVFMPIPAKEIDQQLSYES